MMIGPSAFGIGTMLLAASAYASSGRRTTIHYSLDRGFTWTPCPGQPSTGTNINGISTISTNGSVWVASVIYIDNNGGPFDQVWYSLNGINWVVSPSSQSMIPTNSVNPTQGDVKFVTSFCWNGTIWVCSVCRGATFYSYDGITWSSATIPSYDPVQSITFNGTKFIAVLGNYSGTTFFGAYNDNAATASSQMESLDGITWTLKPGISGSINAYYVTSKTTLPFINPVNVIKPYIPANSAHWASPPPTDIAAAIDRLAALSATWASGLP
jgi:hypothetical protein